MMFCFLHSVICFVLIVITTIYIFVFLHHFFSPSLTLMFLLSLLFSIFVQFVYVQTYGVGNSTCGNKGTFHFSKPRYLPAIMFFGGCYVLNLLFH